MPVSLAFVRSQGIRINNLAFLLTQGFQGAGQERLIFDDHEVGLFFLKKVRLHLLLTTTSSVVIGGSTNRGISCLETKGSSTDSCLSETVPCALARDTTYCHLRLAPKVVRTWT